VKLGRVDFASPSDAISDAESFNSSVPLPTSKSRELMKRSLRYTKVNLICELGYRVANLFGKVDFIRVDELLTPVTAVCESFILAWQAEVVSPVEATRPFGDRGIELIEIIRWPDHQNTIVGT
jgi:hypothetical protein